MADFFRYNVAPEEVGIASRKITAIHRRLGKRRFLSHSVIVIKDDCVVSEGYYKPFLRDDRHRMYSTSKTFVAAAIGMLAGEGKLSIDDPVIKYFPERLPEEVHPYLAETTLRDLLVMSTPYSRPTYHFDRTDWVDSFFNKFTPTRPSGTYFNYDTAGTFILNVIVEKLTGKPFMKYLEDTLFRDTDFSRDVRCVNSPDGWSWGGSGVLCTPLDLARLASVFLHEGKVAGEQRMPADFAREAVKRQIDNNPSGHLAYNGGHGYGYQIWRAYDDCFSFNGMGGQFAIVCPRHNLIMVTTSDMQGGESSYQLLFECFYRDLVEPLDERNAPLPADPAALAELRELTANLTCPIPMYGEASSPYEKEYIGVTYRFPENPTGIEWLRLEGAGKDARLVFFARGEEKVIAFGYGEYAIAPFPEVHYDGVAMGTPMGRGYRTMSAALWTEERKLVIRSYLIDDYFGNMATTLSFKKNTCTMLMMKTAEHFLGEYQGMAVGVAD